MATQIMKVIQELGANKCVSVVTDNASNMQEAWLETFRETLADVHYVCKFVRDHHHVLTKFIDLRREYKISWNLGLSVPTRTNRSDSTFRTYYSDELNGYLVHNGELIGRFGKRIALVDGLTVLVLIRQNPFFQAGGHCQTPLCSTNIFRGIKTSGAFIRYPGCSLAPLERLRNFLNIWLPDLQFALIFSKFCGSQTPIKTRKSLCCQESSWRPWNDGKRW
ncbi:hypothetical protein ROZALSC1DRAFT_24579, partial [Rozella allomycis CSF55]